MTRALTCLACIGMLGAVGCAEERVLGYCGQGDTCRYDGSERVLVRTYSGFIQPKPVEVADMGVEAVSNTVEETASVSTPPEGSATLVSISN